jgi:hypothetical protein
MPGGGRGGRWRKRQGGHAGRFCEGVQAARLRCKGSTALEQPPRQLLRIDIIC